MSKIDPLSIRTPIRDDFPEILTLCPSNARGFVALAAQELQKKLPEITDVVQIGVVVPIKINGAKESDLQMRDSWIACLNKAAKSEHPIQFYPVNDILLSNKKRRGAYFISAPSIAFAHQSFADRTRECPYYIMCDDYYFNGGTLAALHHAIEQNGGHTLAAATKQIGGGIFSDVSGIFAQREHSKKYFQRILTDDGKVTNEAAIEKRLAQINAVLGQCSLSIETLTQEELNGLLPWGSIWRQEIEGDTTRTTAIPSFRELLRKMNLHIIPRLSSGAPYEYSLIGLRSEDLSARSRQAFQELQ